MLKIATFKGGVHPPDSKKITENSKIEILAPPATVVLPLQQHIGAPLEPVVAPGDQVKIGTLVAKPTGFVSVPLHATVSGKVKSVAEQMHPAGVRMQSVTIESDGQDTWEDLAGLAGDWRELSVENLKKRIQEAGIVGLGGAAFPTHVKLSPPAGKKIDTFILNGAECEPYLTADYRQMIERTAELVAGMQMIARILGCRRTLVAIETNKPEALEALEKAVAGQEGFEVAPVETKYPQGGEKQLIQALTGREVPTGGLPMDVNCLVQNVSTVLAVQEAVTAGRPLVDKVVTLTGQGVKKPGNYLVRVGMLVEDLLRAVEGEIDEEIGKIVMGGPMMGIALPSLDVPVLKGTNGLVVFRNPVQIAPHNPCIRCGSCVDACPVRLLPCELALFAENERWDKCREYFVKDCIECGACSYTCPAGRNLVQLIRYGKFTVMNQDRLQKK